MKNSLFQRLLRASLLAFVALLLPSLGGAGGGCLFAQQAPVDKRSSSQLVFPEFKPAKVRQQFGRVTRGRCNIMYKNAALCFIDDNDGKIHQAIVDKIVGVDFDSCRYVKVDDLAMGLVVGEQDGMLLLRVTTIDMDRYRELTGGSTDLPYVSIDLGTGVDTFVDLSGAEQQENSGYPLKDRWVFQLRDGSFLPATERNVKKHVKKELKIAFQTLMGDRLWSWRDEESLKKLFMFFE